jgi:hypothetical protein
LAIKYSIERCPLHAKDSTKVSLENPHLVSQNV